MDPYFNADFFSWFVVLLSRLPSICCGAELFADEVQLLVMGFFALGASFVGVFLVLKKLVMMANAISHTMLLSIALAFVAFSGAPPEIAVVLSCLAVALLTGALIPELSRAASIREDASNALVFSSLFALGVVILSVWSRNVDIGPELLMGNPDALLSRDIPFVAVVSIASVALGLLLARGFALSIFDPTFAHVVGFSPHWFERMLLAQVALTTVSAFRAVGFVMTLSFFTFPALVASRLSKSLSGQLLLAPLVGLVAVIFSLALSRHLFSVCSLAVSTGALASSLLALFYIVILARGCVCGRALGVSRVL